LENSHFSFRLLRKRPFCVVECSWIFSALCFRFFTTKPNHHRRNLFFPCFCGLHFVFHELLCSFWLLNTHFKVSNWINSLAVRFINFLNAAFVCCLLKLWKSTAVYSVALVSLYAINKPCVCVCLWRECMGIRVLRSVRGFRCHSNMAALLPCCCCPLEGDSRQGCQRVQKMDTALWISSGLSRVLSGSECRFDVLQNICYN